ncbi:MAG: UvrD-helicase domain-containing protein [Endomicrobium sp.]|jgi:hypothetical protein|nr:UvrD-helicase domain-containing protein [Endomicrobium sp.]
MNLWVFNIIKVKVNDNLFVSLNIEQSKAVRYINGSLIVFASAGTGKTVAVLKSLYKKLFIDFVSTGLQIYRDKSSLFAFNVATLYQQNLLCANVFKNLD